jgi:hypothetical protein
MSFRCSRWASSSSRITELRPTMGSSRAAPSPGCRTSGGAMNSARASAGSERNTAGGRPSKRSVKRVPWRRRSRSRYAGVRVHQPIVWTSFGTRGPGGSCGSSPDMGATLPAMSRADDGLRMYHRSGKRPPYSEALHPPTVRVDLPTRSNWT